MSTSATRLWRWLERRQIDKLAAGIGLVIGLLMVPLRFVLTTVYAETFPIALVGASGLYLLSLYTGGSHHRPTLSTTIVRFAPAVTFAAMSVMVAIAAFAGQRTPQFYDLGIAATTVVLLQILFARDEDLNPTIVLVQVLALTFVIRGAALYTTPGFIGIDVWTHVTDLAASVEARHSIAALDGKYSMAPFYHVYVAVASMIGGVSLRDAVYLTIAIAVPLGVLFVYGLAREFVPVRWSLLAVAMYTVGDDVIEWSIHPIPTSLGLLFFLAGLYVFVRYLNGHTDGRTVLLLLIFLGAVNLTHQVSAFILLVTIGIGFFTQVALGNGLLYPNLSTRNVMGFFAFDLGLLTLIWTLTPYRDSSFTGAMVEQLRRTVETDAGLFKLSGGAASAASSQNPKSIDPFVMTLAQYVDILGLVTLFGVAVVGSIYILHHRRAEQATVTLVGAIVAMMTYSLGLPLLGINSFVPGRWIAFLYAPMVVVGVVGIGYLHRELPVSLATVTIVVLLLLYPGSMLLSTTATLDNPVFHDIKPKVAFDDQELASMETFGATVNADTTVRGDSPYVNVLERSQDVDAAISAVPKRGPIPHDFVVYRPYQSTGAPIFFQNGTTAIVHTSHDRMCTGRSQVYDNGEVTACVA